jgi:uncharacterized membrane protein
MLTFKNLLSILFGLIMIVGGITHFAKPEMYLPFIPDFLPKTTLNYVAGVLEFCIGMAIFIPRTRHFASLGILLLMIAFLPLHVIDVYSENPAIGSHQLALIRLPLQFVLIAWAWVIYKK